MFSLPLATAADPWLLAEALQRCDSARDRVEQAIVDLRSIDADCTWKARGVEFLKAGLEQRTRELSAALEQVCSVEDALRAGAAT